MIAPLRSARSGLAAMPSHRRRVVVAAQSRRGDDASPPLGTAREASA
jgi:hypothetical protein